MAAALSVPFGILSAEQLNNPTLGIFVGGSFFSYSVFLASLIKRQPPLIFKRLFPRKMNGAPKSITDLAGLKIDFVGEKGPNELHDGLIHSRRGELQRIFRIALPKRSNAQTSLWLETLFSYLSEFSDCRFQLIFPEESHNAQRDLILVASLILTPPSKDKLELPPLPRMQEVVGLLLEKLIILGAAPKLLSSAELRLLISNELGSETSRFNLQKDWRHVRNLGWEPSFRDIEVRAGDKFIKFARHMSSTIHLEQAPKTNRYSWLATVLSDLPDARVSMFLSPQDENETLKKLKTLANIVPSKSQGAEPALQRAKISFYLRWESNDSNLLENEVALAQKFLNSLGIKSKSMSHRQFQLHSWRATIPCALDPEMQKAL